MTKEELAKKKGIKVAKETQTPSEKLLTSLPATGKVKLVLEPKKSVGKPKKRKEGDKKMSFWIDADLVDKLYANLKYGDTVGNLINKALREYLEKE